MHISDETGRFAVTENDGATVRSRYQHSDHPGSSHLETDGSGAVISHEEYHPFGTTAYQATLTSLGPAAKRYRFCGKERDEESGLYYYGARYYASWLGRFVSVDPKESKYFFQSSYAYAENSPVTKMDWNGEGSEDEKPKKNQKPDYKSMDGKTDVFDNQGNFVGSIASKNNEIRILKVDKSKVMKDGKLDSSLVLNNSELPSQGDYSVEANKERLSKIATYYFKIIGYDASKLGDGGKIGFRDDPYNPGVLMRTGNSNNNSRNITFALHGTSNYIHSLLDNKFNLMSALHHEAKHFFSNRLSDEYQEELRSYKTQINDKSFNFTSEDFKTKIIKSIQEYLGGIKNEKERNSMSLYFQEKLWVQFDSLGRGATFKPLPKTPNPLPKR